MTFKESFHALMNFEKPDLLLQFEWGYWNETIERWRKEGLVDNQEPWEDSECGITCYERAPIKVGFEPEFERKVLEDNEETQIIQDTDGVIKRIPKKGTAFPQFLHHPVQNLDDFEKIKERLNPHSKGRYPEDWSEQVKQLESRDTILVLGQCDISFFGGIRDLMGLENLLFSYYDNPELIKRINEYRLWFTKELYDKALKEVKFDCAFIWEDMAFKNGPFISPELFREFMLPYYKDLTSWLKNRGIKWIILDSDGNIEKLVPLFVEGGIDGLLPFECAAGLDIREIRKKYPHLRILGGIDKREIAKGKEAIDKELESKLPFMFSKGGYIPTLDHHVHPQISYENFKYYLKKTREIYMRCKE